MSYTGSKLLTRVTIWRLCPYSTDSEDLRIPDGEKSDHTTTEGKMVIGRGGTFICYDDLCSFYTGTATTPIYWKRYDACSQTVVSGTATPEAGKRFHEN